MLKALELVGFKSFADKTRLDFPDGISVVVGPNGSGKSNIVDAIKWVLGEQSAKSLRGKEMTDVIFKGSGAGASARKPSNTAEATIIFDNSDGRLSLDAPEIHVTRRVYRSGEGEYLINRQACRLRDIKDLFRGTGVGTDAYSLIEQGKVDTLLQASVRDRRAIFEEAAGISRFKAKKVEAQRRLERVEQNLLRLSDIVEEVESRLRTLRAQASKARRYREYTDRLQQLRTQVAQVDWRRLSERLAACQEELAELQQQTQGLSSRQQSVEARILESETEIALVDEELRSGDARIAQTGERIRSQESTAQRERERLAEAQSQEARFRRQLVAMNTRAGDAVSQLRNVADELHNAQNVFREATKQRDDKSSRVEEQTSRVEQLRVETRDLRDRHMQRLRHHSELESQIVADQERLKTSEQAETRATESLEALQSKRNQCTSKLHSQQEIGQRLSSTVTAQKAELTVLRNELANAKSGLTSIQNQLSEKRGQCAGNRERAKVLEELESRLEGVGSGVKTVLKLGREQPQGVFGGVRGLIADLISAGVDAAPMVDIALGPQSQCVVFAGTRLVEHLKSGEYELPGRVGFLSLESALPLDHTYHIDLSGQPGVIGRADHFVEVPREYRLLIRRLVGTTWFVESLDHAISLSQTLGRGLRYVTRTGELLDVDGRLLVGPMQSHAGLVSRRSELRALRDQLVALEGNLRELSDEERRLHAATAKLDEQLETLVATHQQSIAELAEHKLLINSENQRLAEVDRQISSLQSELRTVAVQRQSTAERLESARHQCKSVNVELGEIQAEMQARETELAELDAKRRADLEELTALRVEVGKKEQRVESLHTHLAQLQRDQQDRGRALTETRRHIDHWASQRRRTELDILAATSKASEMHLQLENDSQFRAARQHHRDALITTRAELVDQVSHLRHEMRESEQRQHRAQLAASQASQERDSLAERLRDDYDIELAQLDDVSDDRDVKQREAVEQEITDLRRKISNIGPVNLDALNELESIEDRHGSLADQYRDLVDAKESLQRIIQKINKDSRRLFKETLEAIRVNFQGMFRKVFGGGRADILLEDGVDILESGIDLVATPPGKQTLGLSLLSGGERALTAVTLLLAIFKYRPSPFCVLDEVDGPLDEANIDRFIDVLHGFLDSTKFVVVTHSKKTMTAANTLYGITMQESGISKRVAVQFEDVSDDGHISREAVERDTTGETIADSDERGAA